MNKEIKDVNSKMEDSVKNLEAKDSKMDDSVKSLQDEDSKLRSKDKDLQDQNTKFQTELEKTANESKDEDANTLKMIGKLKSDRDTFQKILDQQGESTTGLETEL